MPINLSQDRPATVEAAVDQLYAGLLKHELEVLRAQFGGLSGKLFTLGQAIIEQWGLESDETALYLDCRDRFKLGNSDDVVALILNAVDAKIQRNEFFNLNDRAQVLRVAWHEMKMDPAIRHRKFVEESRKIFGGAQVSGEGGTKARLQ